MKPLLLFCLFLGFLIILSCSTSKEQAPLGEEQQASAFLAEHVRQVEPKFKALNLADWNANATGEKKFYDEKAAVTLDIRTIYSKQDEFQQVKKWNSSAAIKDPLVRRQLTLLYNNYLPNQLDVALMRQIVEKEAEVASTFNTHRPRIDGKEVNDNDIAKILKEEKDSTIRRKAWEAGKEVGKQVAPMVLALVKLRNQAAQQLGFKNFYEMSLTTSEQSVAEVSSLFDELKTLTDEPFRKLKGEIDTGLSSKYGIRPEEMRPWHYQDPFFQEPPQIGGVNLDGFFRQKQVDELARRFYAGIGTPVEDILQNSDIYGRKGKYQHAFATDIDRLGDIRTMLSITDNYYWMGTMLHELGHCVYSKYIQRDLPFILRDAAHAFLTEAIAMLMERQAGNAEWLQAMVGISEADQGAVSAAGRETLRRKALIFCRWEQVMMRFERALYENPDQNLNQLWWDLVKSYQFVTPPEKRDAPDWAAKIHLAQYPAYYHNYQLGELTASQLQSYIIRNVLKQKPSTSGVCFAGKPEVGEYLKNKVFAPGASRRWDDLMKYATGEPLSAKFFAEEYL